jgi:hypothetical protein
LRTTETSDNGAPQLVSSSGAASTALTHVIYKRAADGAVSLIVDGVEVASGLREGTFANWDDSYRLALADEFVDDRDWLGELHCVAIYSEAATP